MALSMFQYGDAPLLTAARYGHVGVTRILISARCRVSSKNKNGDTALHIAAAMGKRKLVRVLAEAGIYTEARNNQGDTARDIAIRKHHLEIINVIDMASGGHKPPGLITDPIKQIISDLDNNKKSYKDSREDSQYSESTSIRSGNVSANKSKSGLEVVR